MLQVAEYWFGWVRLTAHNATHLQGEFVEAGAGEDEPIHPNPKQTTTVLYQLGTADAGAGGAVLDDFLVLQPPPRALERHVAGGWEL